MFLRHTIDITDWVINGDNLLSILVHPVDHPGHIPIEGGQGGDHDVSRNFFYLNSIFIFKSLSQITSYNDWKFI